MKHRCMINHICQLEEIWIDLSFLTAYNFKKEQNQINISQQEKAAKYQYQGTSLLMDVPSTGWKTSQVPKHNLYISI